MLNDQLRDLIRSCGQTRYAIAKATGIGESHLSKFMLGKSGLSVENIEAILQHLGYELRVVKRGKHKQR